MELALGVHQLCLAPLDPNPLVHLPDQTRLEGPNHLHGEFHLFTLVRNKTMLPKGIFLLLELKGALVFFSTTVAIAASLTLVGHLLQAPLAPLGTNILENQCPRELMSQGTNVLGN